MSNPFWDILSQVAMYYLVIAIICTAIVMFDAEARYVKNRGTWTLLTFLFPVIGLLLYFALAQPQPKAPRTPETISWLCRYCFKPVPAGNVFCPHCGKSQK